MTISQLVPFARSAGLGAAVATLALPVTAAGNAGGRILSGWLSDALGRVTTLRLMVLASAVAMPALFVWRAQAVLFFVLVACVYWCYGTQLSVFASATADLYGTRNLGLNYGVLFTAWGAAGVFGPMIGGRVFDSFGDYRYAFYAASALAVVALWIAVDGAANKRMVDHGDLRGDLAITKSPNRLMSPISSSVPADPTSTGSAGCTSRPSSAPTRTLRGPAPGFHLFFGELS